MKRYCFLRINKLYADNLIENIYERIGREKIELIQCDDITEFLIMHANNPFDVIIFDFGKDVDQVDFIKFEQVVKAIFEHSVLKYIVKRNSDIERLLIKNSALEYLYYDTSDDIQIEKIIQLGELSGESNTSNFYQLGKWKYYPDTSTLRSIDKTQYLTTLENVVLKALCLEKGNVLSKDTLYEIVYPYQIREETRTNKMEVHIRNLRAKIGRDVIKTAHGYGYYIE